MHKITNITEKQLRILEKNELDSLERIARAKPKKLYDCRCEKLLSADAVGKGFYVKGILQNIDSQKTSSGKMMTKALIRSNKNGFISVIWFNTNYPAVLFRQNIDSEVVVFGNLSSSEYNGKTYYQIISPFIFSNQVSKYDGKIIYSLKKMKGLSEDDLDSLFESSMITSLEEPFTDRFRQKYDLWDLNKLSFHMKKASNPAELSKAYKQIDTEDLLYFATNMHLRKRITADIGPIFTKSEITQKIIDDLPYKLTEDQLSTVMKAFSIVKSGKLLNELVQGDVSCGKSIVAFLLLAMCAENGYQGVLLAPTIVLASQHYEDTKKFLEPYGIKCVFLNSGLKAKEKREIYKQISSGEAQIIVGTHSVVGKDVNFTKLGMVVIDEEQRFGVTCRDALREKNPEPVHYISMSATPIPRTMATCIFGEDMTVSSIKSMPSGRKPVKTSVTNLFDVPDILKTELKAGRQAYVVCAQIEEDEEKEQILSVEKTAKIYQAKLPRYRIGVLTGNMKDAEVLQVMKDYMDKKIDVLISTTVIEVGVNNPNSSVIVIQNAERFGLSSLHQLRGRVRRGIYDPYCILISENTKNERLKAMCQTDNGFKLSELDLEQRGSGNIIGTKQSGRNHFVELVLHKPDEYKEAQKMAEDLVLNNEHEQFLKIMKEIYSTKDIL